MKKILKCPRCDRRVKAVECRTDVVEVTSIDAEGRVLTNHLPGKKTYAALPCKCGLDKDQFAALAKPLADRA